VVSQFKLYIYNISSNCTEYKKVCEVGGDKEKFISCCWSGPQIGNLLGAASLNGKVNIYRENNTGNNYESIFSLGEQSTVNCISFSQTTSSNEFEFCIGFSNGELGVVQYLQEKWTYKKKKAHKYGVSSLVCYRYSDHSILFTSGNDSLIKLWFIVENDFDLTTITLDKVHTGPVTSLSIVQNENDTPYLISFGNKEEIYYWDLNEILKDGTNKIFNKLNTNNFTQSINSFASSLCGKYYTLANSDGVNVFVNDKNDNLLISSTGNDGVLVDKDN
jgi:WD40 repeat protein